jgi:hypothetical protein
MPPQKAILDILGVSGKVVLKLITDVRQSWREGGQVIKNIVYGGKLQMTMDQKQMRTKKIILLYQRAPWNHRHHCRRQCHHQHPWKHTNV